MEYYPSFLLSELSPPKDTQTKVDCCGVQRINITLNINLKIAKTGGQDHLSPAQIDHLPPELIS